MKKGDVVAFDEGFAPGLQAKITGRSKGAVAVRWIAGPLAGRDALIDEAAFRSMKPRELTAEEILG
jgi:hypothetical protein